MYFVAVWLYIGAQSDANRGLPAGFYLTALVVRLAGIAWLGLRATSSGDVVGAPAEYDGDGLGRPSSDLLT